MANQEQRENDEAGSMDAAVIALVLKYDAILTEFVNAEREKQYHEALVQAAKERMDAAIDKYNACFVAAKLFEVDLKEEFKKYINRSNPLLIRSTQAKEDISIHSSNEGPPKKTKTVKDFVMEALKASYPSHVQAGPIRKLIEEATGNNLHEKTVGMTLYRLYKEGFVRRVGRNWFLVPDHERELPPPGRGEESSGDDPELLLDGPELTEGRE